MKLLVGTLFAVLVAVQAGDNRTPKGHHIVDSILMRGPNGQLRPLNEDIPDSVVCDDCQRIVRTLDIVVHDAEKLEEFKSVLKMLCGYFGSEEREECKVLVDNIDALVHKLQPLLDDPVAACESLGLCGTVEISHYMRVFLVHFDHLVFNGENDMVCDECQFVVQELKTIMAQEGTKAEVKTGLDTMCTQVLSGDTAKKCVNIVDTYLPFIWDELVALMSDAKTVCVDLSLCQSSDEVLAVRSASNQLIRLLPAMHRSIQHSQLPWRQSTRLTQTERFLRRIQTRSGINAGCLICKIGWNGLIDVIKDGQLLDLIAFLGKFIVCNKVLPHDYAAGCNDFVGIYLKPVLVMTLDELDANHVCNALHLCNTTDMHTIHHLVGEERNAALCEACTLAATFLQSELSDQSVQDDITHLVEQICNEFSGDERKECDQILETYLPAIFQSVSVELNPSKLCPELGMCPGGMRASRVHKKDRLDFNDV